MGAQGHERSFMEIKINKEIRKYEEEFFMGLNFRKAVCAVIAMAIGLVVGLGLRKYLSIETISWLIPMAVIPLFIIGFKSFQGLPFEKFLIVYVRHKFATAKKLTLGNDNYNQIMREQIRRSEKNGKKKEK